MQVCSVRTFKGFFATYLYVLKRVQSCRTSVMKRSMRSKESKLVKRKGLRELYMAKCKGPI